MKKWYILSGIVAALACASVALAEPGFGAGRGGGGDGRGPRHDGPGPGMILHRVLDNPELAKKVGLTDQQVADLKASVLATQKQMIKLRSDVELAELEVRRLMDENPVDRDALMKAIDVAGAAQLAVRKAGVEERLKVREIVGQETLDKIRELVADRIADRRGGEGRREGRGERREGRGQRGEGQGVGQGQGQDKGPAWMQEEMPPPAE